MYPLLPMPRAATRFGGEIRSLRGTARSCGRSLGDEKFSGQGMRLKLAHGSPAFNGSGARRTSSFGLLSARYGKVLRAEAEIYLRGSLRETEYWAEDTTAMQPPVWFRRKGLAFDPPWWTVVQFANPEQRKRVSDRAGGSGKRG